MRIRVGELGINFIRDDEKVVLATDHRDFLQLRRRHDGPGRVGREIHEQHLGLGRDRRPEGLGAQLELILFLGANRHGMAMRECNARAVGNIARLVIKHFVAGVEHRPQGEIERLGDADADEDFRRRVIAQRIIRGDVI